MLLLGAAGAVLAALAAGCGGPAQAQTSTQTPPVVRADVESVAYQSAQATYEATGTVRATLNATLSAKTMARVATLAVHDGDSIRQGETLVKLDAREPSAAVDQAAASYRSSLVAVDNARTAAEMEDKSSAAQIAQAQAKAGEAAAAVAAAQARLDLALAGPRSQEVDQSRIAVLDAASSLKLAKTELTRVSTLVKEGALPQSRLDTAQNVYELAQGRYDTAVQSENIAHEGSRSQEIRAAREAVAQAKAALQEAKAGVVAAKAAALQTKVRRGDVEAARAQVSQNSAALESARVGLSYTLVTAPFDGRVAHRMVDPGTMASPGGALLAVEGGEYRIEATVPEDVLPLVSMGSTASVHIDALGDKAIVGRVVEIVPQGDASTHSFTVKFALPTTPQLRSGMFGRVSIGVGKQKRLLIPSSAVWDREGLHCIYTLNDEGVARMRIVTLGRTYGDKVEALSGLNPGDRIVAGSREGVSDGVKVEAATR
jgi:HlyD family secretion protein